MSRLLLLTVLATLAPAARGQAPFRFPEAKHGKGELKYVNGLPVLRVAGTPAEVGGQIGVLALKPGIDLFDKADQFVKEQGLGRLYPVLLKMAGGLEPNFPKDHLRELDAAAKAVGAPRDLLVFGNSLPDLMKIGGCSGVVVAPPHTATGGPLFGRNLDWPPFEDLPERALVIVNRTTGKRPFAVVTYPGMFGVSSGMNDAGLALATFEVRVSADKAAFNPEGVPYTFYLRRVLEECATVAEAETLIRSLKRTTTHAVTLCDKDGGVVLEITPKTVHVRKAEEGLTVCTNHFRTDGLAVLTSCPRYDALAGLRGKDKVTVADVAKKLDAANQGAATIQTMVFEPAALRLHLAVGRGPTSAKPLRELDLKPLFEAKGR
jgi:hypothetical protein